MALMDENLTAWAHEVEQSYLQRLDYAKDARVRARWIREGLTPSALAEVMTAKKVDLDLVSAVKRETLIAEITKLTVAVYLQADKQEPEFGNYLLVSDDSVKIDVEYKKNLKNKIVVKTVTVIP